MKILTKPWPLLSVAVRILLGGVFVYSGLIKIGAPQAFADSVASFRLVPLYAVNSLAVGLPVFELLLGLWLVTGWRRRSALFCVLVLAGIFLIALSSALIRGIPVDCGCFGSGGDPLLGSGHTTAAIGRDVVLLATAAVLYVSSARAEKSSEQ